MVSEKEKMIAGLPHFNDFLYSEDWQNLILPKLKRFIKILE